IGHGATERTLKVFRVVGIPGDLLVDLTRVDIFELEASADAIEDVGILFRRQSSDRARGIIDLAFGFGHFDDLEVHGQLRIDHRLCYWPGGWCRASSLGFG